MQKLAKAADKVSIPGENVAKTVTTLLMDLKKGAAEGCLPERVRVAKTIIDDAKYRGWVCVRCPTSYFTDLGPLDAMSPGCSCELRS